MATESRYSVYCESGWFVLNISRDGKAFNGESAKPWSWCWIDGIAAIYRAMIS